MFLGKVVLLTPGWNVVANRASTLVHVEPVEVFNDSGRRLQVGGEYVYLQDAGVIVVGGVRHCTVDDAHPAAQLGELRLVPASLDSINDHLLTTGSSGVFPVADGFIIDPVAEPAAASTRETVSMLRAAAKERVR